MTLKKDDVYSFDNSSILNQCEIIIPKAYRTICGGKEKLSRNTQPKLLYLCSELDKNEIPKYRFAPVDWERAVIKFGDSILIEQVGNVQMLGNVFQDNIVNQLLNFAYDVMNKFSVIKKDADIAAIVEMFKERERKLTKSSNLPENEDCEILRGLQKFESKGTKHIISMDEHFWGYKDVIWNELKIRVIEEWSCHLLAR